MRKPSPAREKSYEFAVAVVTFCRKFRDPSVRPLISQLIRAGTSVAANVEEASAAQSRKDFVSKMAIASKEAREANFWLRLLRDANVITPAQSAELLNRSLELVRILTAIVKTTQASERAVVVELKTKNSKLKTASVLKEAL